MRMHHLLNATALALILGVAPVAAQQSQTETDTPQAQQEETQAPGTTAGEKSDAMKSTESPGDAGDTGDTAGDPGAMDEEDRQTGSVGEDEQDERTGSIGEDEEPGSGEARTGEAMDEEPDSAEGSATANVQGGFIGQQQQGEILASNLIGQPVVNANNESIGDINDLLFSETDELVGVVIGVGGFLGIGEKSVAMSIDDLSLQQDENGEDMLVASMSQAQLEEAPEFETLEEIELAQNQAEQQAAAEREEGTPGMAPEPDSEPRAMDEEPAEDDAPGSQNQ